MCILDKNNIYILIQTEKTNMVEGLSVEDRVETWLPGGHTGTIEAIEGSEVTVELDEGIHSMTYSEVGSSVAGYGLVVKKLTYDLSQEIWKGSLKKID